MSERDDIDDVVSSIRRLVSGGPAAVAAEAEAAKPRPAPILLLGPSNRVADAERGGAAGGEAPSDGEAHGSLADLSDAAGGEDALREMIAEVVRAELAGPLGERITRNVRKLVRREMRTMGAQASDE